MKKYITFGNWNKDYLYIIAACISYILFDVTNGCGYYYYTLQLSDSKFSGHIYIHKLFNYSLILICSFLFYLYEKVRDKNKNKKKEESKDDYSKVDELTNFNSIALIHHDVSYYTNKKISNKFVFLIIFLYVVFDYIDQMVGQYFSFGDFWMVDLLIMAYLCNKMLKMKIYQHQLFAIYLVSIPFILKTATIILLFSDEKNYLKNDKTNYKYDNESTLLKSLFVVHAWLFPISFIIYFIKMIMDSYIIISIKKIMDLKYVSISKILIIYGGFGTLFTALFCLVTTYIPCGKRNNDVYDIYDYQFLVVDDEGNRFIENYKVYFGQYFLKDLLLFSFIRGIENGLYKLFLLKYVQNLNPVFKSFSYSLIYIMHKFILVFQVKSNEPMKYLNARFFLDFASDFAAIIGFLIYLEIIELNFCNLNLNLRKYIIIRSKLDSTDMENDNEISILSEDDEMK